MEDTDYKYVLNPRTNIMRHKDWNDIQLRAMGYNTITERIKEINYANRTGKTFKS